MKKFKNALVSVSDKTGLVEFLKPLVDSGLRIVSTGGTAQHLKKHGFEVVDVSEQTGFPEVMDGRVKTLHPRIHMALLSRENHAPDLQILRNEKLEPFDLVVVNLYPFEEQLQLGKSEDELYEYIDIGGPSLLRAASKNFSRITVVCDPKDYAQVQVQGFGDLSWRKYLASKVFSHVSNYDGMIAQELGAKPGEFYWGAPGKLHQTLRYGENPHQQAFWYERRGADRGIHQAKILQGKELSYNNLLDLEAAFSLVNQFSEPCAVAVKHNNPCGVAVGKSPSEALTRALQADPVSVFGGIVATNFPIDRIEAQELNKIFLECVISPQFSESALEALKAKKNLRLLQWPKMNQGTDNWKVRSVSGGFLWQQTDFVDVSGVHWTYFGERPNPKIHHNLEIAWRTVAALKSNAIAVVGEGQTIGLGMGQVNRIDAVLQSLTRWKQFHPQISANVVLASDAFFPFADSIQPIYDAGIRWILQPGGSVRDQEVIAAVKSLGINMIFTGQRHFNH
ncbi:MAG: bifunctional phosphoribosylaminoimidazolecarboxamide formyltransferase/IMP cyclohydrolase [Bdellovibrionales bacterium]|nr:bifunctional phosphoribosylaminoimidazolecarboxamide formyltransferase/IMP cyclohydrolase [Bdellovibrionales bacterium]